MRIGLIGCGKQAPKHISGLQAVDGAVQIVLCDLDADRARRLAAQHALAWSASADDVLADPSVDAIDIATPTLSHAPLIERAIAAGKHFLCEKPLCESLAQARAIEAATARAGVIGMVGYIYRFAPVFEIGRGLHRQDDTGDAPLGRAVTAHFRLGGRGEHELWKHRRASGGGAASEMLVHMLDLATWYFGRVRDAELLANDLLRPVRRIGGCDVEVDAEDFILVRLEMEHCEQVFVQADLVTPSFNQFVEIQYERGSFFGSIQPEMPSYVFAAQAAGHYRAGRNPLDFGATNLFERQMGDFIGRVIRREQPDRNSIRDSIVMMEAVDMLRDKGLGR